MKGYDNVKAMVSIKIQKIIMFIPILNFSLFFIWLYNYSRMRPNIMLFLKSLFVAFGCSLPIVIICILIDQLHNEILLYLTKFIMLYIIPLSIGLGLVRYQQKILEEE